MFTFFHLIELLALLCGAALGALLGVRQWGIWGAAPGLAAGAMAGWLAGKAPFFLAWRLTSPRRKSTAELRERLRNQGTWPYHHVALSELKRRGEPIEREWPLVRDLLSSEDEARRVHGWSILCTLFPELASQIPEFDPHSSTETCQARLAKVAWPPGTD